MGLGGDSRGGEHFKFGFVLEVEPTESTGRLDRGCDRKRGIKDESMVYRLSD